MFKKQKAFTLIELLVTLSVFGLLAALAVPSFQTQITNNRSLTLTDEFIGALNFARSEALKRGKPVTLCPANTTATDCGSNWLGGWLVIVDTAANETKKPPVVADQDSILRRWETTAKNSKITLSESREFIRYTGLGTLAKSENNASAVITLKVDKCSGNNANEVTVAVSGMLTNKHISCND